MRPLRCALVGAFVLSLLAGLAPAAAQTPFPPGWRRIERAPIVLGSGATLTVHLAESARRGAFLFVTDPLPAAEAGQAWQAIRDRLLGRAQVRQDLGARRETRGERRTRVVEGSVVAGDGKPRRAFGEVQIIAGAPGVWLAGFLNAQDDSEPPQTYEAAANWVVAVLPRGAGTSATQQAAAAPKPQQQAAAPKEPSAPQAATAVAPAPAPVLAPPPAETRRSLLPAALGPGWRKAAWGGGDFDKQATFGPDGLVVDMPAGARGATGILSTQTVLRLGEFRPGAAARLTLRFDPARTSAALVFLCPGRSDNCASDPGLTASWTRTADGAAGTLRWAWADGRKKEAATGPRLEDFTIELRPEGARIAAAGATLDGEIAAARPHAAFEIAVQATPPAEGAAAMLALKQIDIAQTRGPVDPAKPAAGVPALASRTAFAGAPSDAWKPFAAHGGDFGKFARWQGGALIVDVPEKHYWGTTGVISAAPALTIPRLSRRAPARIAVTLDPRRTRSGVILLNRAPTEDVWFQQVVWVQWSGRPDGAGRLDLSLCASPARLYALETPPGWDGRMEIEIAQEFAAVRLAPGWSVGGIAGCVSEDLPLHVSALAQAGAEHAPASIVVSRIEIGRATPDGMTAMDRLEFLEAKEFKPDEFLDVVAGALDAAGAAAPQSDGAKP